MLVGVIFDEVVGGVIIRVVEGVVDGVDALH